MILSLNQYESETVLAWYDATADAVHYGGGQLRTHATMQLVAKLRRSLDSHCDCNDDEIVLIADWMRSAIFRNFGLTQYIFGFERLVYDRITREEARITENLRQSGASPSPTSPA